MASLSQALRLGDLPPPHRTFQGHAAHIIEWSMMLRPNGSWGTCRPQGIATFLHYASRRSAAWRYTTQCGNLGFIMLVPDFLVERLHDCSMVAHIRPVPAYGCRKCAIVQPLW